MISLPQIKIPPGSAPPPAPEDVKRERHRLFDSHGRTIRDLRLSVTDRCNFRCVYCMDPDFRYMPKQELLSLEEYIACVRVLLGLGVTKVRITGGEPTLYAQLDELIERLGAMNIADLSMTTNGSMVTAAKARRWKELGLRRLTLSLDSLRSERVVSITRAKTSPQSVINAIHIAHDAGLGPVKVNAVVMRGLNDDEVADFADFAIAHGIDMRLIEFMPLDSEHAWSRDRVVGAEEMLERIASRHALVREEDEDPSSTSMNYRFASGSADDPSACVTDSARGRIVRTPQHAARIGIIAPVTRPFCGACSRLRITADGKVRPCLFSHAEWDLRGVLRRANGASDEEIASFIIDSMWTKQAGHGIGSKTFHQPQRTMSAIGG